MKVENIFELQDVLRQVDDVSIPWLQKELSVTYSEAKELLEQLMLRGWVSREVQGNRHKVQKENLKIRKIRRSEASTLFDNITSDWVVAINCIQKKTNGAALEEIRAAVREEDEVKQTVEALVSYGLIYCVESLYFSCIRKCDASALNQLQQFRRRSNARRSILDEDDEDEETEKLLQEFFDGLFEA